MHGPWEALSDKNGVVEADTETHALSIQAKGIKKGEFVSVKALIEVAPGDVSAGFVICLGRLREGHGIVGTAFGPQYVTTGAADRDNSRVQILVWALGAAFEDDPVYTATALCQGTDLDDLSLVVNAAMRIEIVQKAVLTEVVGAT